MNYLNIELIALWSALTGYSVASALAVYSLFFRKKPERALLLLMALSVCLHTIAIGARWYRIGHLPVINGFEMLSANIWGLMLAVTVGYAFLQRMRAFAAVVLPVVIMLMAWMLLIPSYESTLPPTYKTLWLYIHIGFIKLFLGSAFVALGLGGIVLLRSANIMRDRLSGVPEDSRLDDIAHRCMAMALIFDTMGIVAGSIWALDAWGRYWSWDPLETWSLVTWLSIGLTLHIRASFHTRPLINALLIVGTFVVAFFTFFGIPFVSTALHKGMI